jgi:ketosteroid isomerase-like protein
LKSTIKVSHKREIGIQFFLTINANTTTSKAEYIEVIKRFSRLFTTMRVKEMIVEGDSACVIGNYDYIFPNGKNINGNVAEIWKAKDGKLASLAIFFDTLTFSINSK